MSSNTGYFSDILYSEFTNKTNGNSISNNFGIERKTGYFVEYTNIMLFSAEKVDCKIIRVGLLSYFIFLAKNTEENREI